MHGNSVSSLVSQVPSDPCSQVFPSLAHVDGFAIVVVEEVYATSTVPNQMQRLERRVVGTVYRRTRTDSNGAKALRAEVRFDGVAGFLRTPTGAPADSRYWKSRENERDRV